MSASLTPGARQDAPGRHRVGNPKRCWLATLGRRLLRRLERGDRGAEAGSAARQEGFASGGLRLRTAPAAPFPSGARGPAPCPRFYHRTGADLSGGRAGSFSAQLQGAAERAARLRGGGCVRWGTAGLGGARKGSASFGRTRRGSAGFGGARRGSEGRAPGARRRRPRFTQHAPRREGERPFPANSVQRRGRGEAPSGGAHRPTKLFQNHPCVTRGRARRRPMGRCGATFGANGRRAGAGALRAVGFGWSRR